MVWGGGREGGSHSGRVEGFEFCKDETSVVVDVAPNREERDSPVVCADCCDVWSWHGYWLKLSKVRSHLFSMSVEELRTYTLCIWNTSQIEVPNNPVL